MFARILNKVARAFGTIRFSQLLLLLLLLIHGAKATGFREGDGKEVA